MQLAATYSMHAACSIQHTYSKQQFNSTAELPLKRLSEGHQGPGTPVAASPSSAQHLATWLFHQSQTRMELHRHPHPGHPGRASYLAEETGNVVGRFSNVKNKQNWE